MARPLRIEYPGALYLITSSGNAKRPIFKNDEDRHVRLTFALLPCSPAFPRRMTGPIQEHLSES